MKDLELGKEFMLLDSNELQEIEGGSVWGVVVGAAKVAAAAATTTAGVAVIATVGTVAVVGVCVYAGVKAGQNKADKEYYESHK